MRHAGSIISIKGGTTTEFHLEQSKLIALDVPQMTVTGSTFIRSLAFVDPDYAMIVNCRPKPSTSTIRIRRTVAPTWQGQLKG
jgi:hypothetical protein